MTCPDRDVLLACAERQGAPPPGVAEHVAACEVCRAVVDELRDSLRLLTAGVEALATEAPASLAAGLVRRLQEPAARRSSGATTLRPGPAGGPRAWFHGYHLAAAGVALLAVLVVVAYLVTGSTPSASAAQVLERSQAALLGALPAEGGVRIVYRVRYEGPTLGALPDGPGDYRVEELYDREPPGGFRITIAGPDGTLVRGVAERGGTRRIVVRTRHGGLDLTFHLEPGVALPDLAETRRQQIARSFFELLLRAARPDRMNHVLRDGRHVVDLGAPAPDAADFAGVVEVDGARVVVEETTYRLESAAIHGRLLGEPFRFEATVESVDLLPPGSLAPEDFSLPTVEGALRLEGEGTAYPLADVAGLLLERVFREGRAPAE